MTLFRLPLEQGFQAYVADRSHLRRFCKDYWNAQIFYGGTQVRRCSPSHHLLPLALFANPTAMKKLRIVILRFGTW
jgi:hypothetical protein